MKPQRDGTDLLCADRGGILGSEEARELSALLKSSSELRFLRQATQEIDADGRVQVGDEQLIRRAASRAASRARAERRPAHLQRLRFAAALLVGMLATSLAAARLPTVAFWLSRLSASVGELALGEKKPEQCRLPQAIRDRHGTQRSSAVPNPAPQTSATLVPSAAGSTSSATVRPASQGRAPVGARPVKELTTPRYLFRAANAARRAGDPTRAIDLYQRAARLEPASAEAATSRLSLGKLLLQAGRAKEALQNFRAVRSADSATKLEALWGEADACRALGESPKERVALQTIASQFPGTPYAALAKDRLARF